MKLCEKLLLITAFATFLGCNQEKSGNQKKDTELPILGNKNVVEKEENGELVKDTIFHQIPDFQLVDQDSNKVTNKAFEDDIYVADFFFTSCPTICPDMKEQMHRVYQEFEEDDDVRFLSHTVDPEHDTPAVLKNYAEKIGVNTDQWKFVTGDMDSIYDLAKTGYMASARQDSAAPGGVLHSGQFFLVDDRRRIRGVYDGTDSTSVNKLISDIRILRNLREGS